MTMYFRRGDGLEVVVLDQYEDTAKRLMQDGWFRIEALTPPTPVAEPQPAPEAAAVDVPAVVAETPVEAPAKAGK